MIDLLKRLFYPLLKVDERSPEIPAGHETDPDVQIIRASPDFWAMKLMLWRIYTAFWAAGFLVASAIIAFSGFALYGFLALGAAAIIVAWKVAALYVIARLDYEMRWYALTSTSVRVRAGVLVMKEVTISFRNAQNVQVLQGPLERLFGISTVRIDTAGGGATKQEPGQTSHRAELRGLNNAAEVRDRVLAILRASRHAGLGDHDDHAHGGEASLFSEKNAALLGEIARETGKLRAAAG